MATKTVGRVQLPVVAATPSPLNLYSPRVDPASLDGYQINFRLEIVLEDKVVKKGMGHPAHYAVN